MKKIGKKENIELRPAGGSAGGIFDLSGKKSPVGTFVGRRPAYPDFVSNRNKFFEIFSAGRPAGFGGLLKADDISRSAEIFVFLKPGGKGKIKPAIEAFSNFGFKKMNLHRIFISLSGGESDLISAAKLSGYRDDGKLRDYFRRSGRREDLVMVGALREEFLAI